MNIEKMIYELSYNDILELPDDIRKPFFKKFLEFKAYIPDDIYSDSIPLKRMFWKIEELENNLYSDYIFNGDKVFYYPNITYTKVTKPFICSVSGARYNRSCQSLIFKPFFYLPAKKEAYVLEKGIRAHYHYEDFFPRTIKEFDIFYYNVINSYELGLEEYYNFFCNIKGELNIKKLKHK